MAKIHEEIVVIKFSKLVKETDGSNSLLSAEILDSITAVAEELAGAGVIVEIDQVQ
jgi:hypothetical protein